MVCLRKEINSLRKRSKSAILFNQELSEVPHKSLEEEVVSSVSKDVLLFEAHVTLQKNLVKTFTKAPRSPTSFGRDGESIVLRWPDYDQLTLFFDI